MEWRISFSVLFALLTVSPTCRCGSALEKIAHWINSTNGTWKADHRLDRGMLLAPFWALPGTRAADPFRFFMSVKRFGSIDRSSIPQEFDSRKQWPYCPTVQQVFEQGKCASCWAVAPADVISDRICIHSKGRQVVRLSAGNLLACCRFCGRGCNGGYPGAAWVYWRRRGIVTGGSFSSDYGCQRYQYFPCSHIASFGKACPSHGPRPQCSHVCQSTYERSYDQDLHYGQSVYRIPNNVEAIQMEIMTHGPVQAVLRVYEDFLTYRTGVYQHAKGRAKEYHAVKIIGWGEEDGVPYWMAVNTWSRRWGMGGFFKILRGRNHIEIESHIMAGIPLLHSESVSENEIDLSEQVSRYGPGNNFL